MAQILFSVVSARLKFSVPTVPLSGFSFCQSLYLTAFSFPTGAVKHGIQPAGQQHRGSVKIPAATEGVCSRPESRIRVQSCIQRAASSACSATAV